MTRSTSRSSQPPAVGTGSSDLSQYFVTIYSGGDTFLDAKLSNGGLDVVADLVGVHASLALISHAIVG